MTPPRSPSPRHALLTLDWLSFLAALALAALARADLLPKVPW